MPTTTTPMMTAITTFFFGEHQMIRRYDQYPASDPVVKANPKMFAPDTTPPQELQRLRLMLDYEDLPVPDEAPQPVAVPMRARHTFTYQVTEDKVVEKGTVVDSTDDVFVLNSRFFERADEPRRGKA